MPSIKVNDISMYYEVHGEGEPLVFISGFGADHLTWAMVREKFAEHYQVILFDNRGAGQTDVPDGVYTIEQMSSDVIALCDGLNIKKAHFIGNSMDGYIAQYIACYYSGYVNSVVISNSAMVRHSCFKFFSEASLALRKANAPLETIIKASISWVFSYGFLSRAGQVDSIVRLRLNSLYPFTIKGHEAQYEVLDTFDSREWVKDINVPTLIVASDEDIILPERLSKDLANEIKHAEYYCFEQCGHLPHIEYPEKYFKVVNKFISKC
jgi:3-oxoadipate enol-lactonase